MTSIEELLARGDRIPADYRHHARAARSGEPIATERILFRWNDVFLPGDPVPEALDRDARAAVQELVASDGIPTGEGFGFVVVHHSTSLDYLLVGVWYQIQEAWITVSVRDAGSDGAFRRVQPGADWSTMCVWEMLPVWHERELWTTYLYSSRDLAARRRWLDATWETIS